MSVEVDTHDRKGSQLGTAQTSSFQTSVFDDYGKDAEADIAAWWRRRPCWD